MIKIFYFKEQFIKVLVLLVQSFTEEKKYKKYHVIIININQKEFTDLSLRQCLKHRYFWFML